VSMSVSFASGAIAAPGGLRTPGVAFTPPGGTHSKLTSVRTGAFDRP
jgi:hypothetical protein